MSVEIIYFRLQPQVLLISQPEWTANQFLQVLTPPPPPPRLASLPSPLSPPPLTSPSLSPPPSSAPLSSLTNLHQEINTLQAAILLIPYFLPTSILNEVSPLPLPRFCLCIFCFVFYINWKRGRRGSLAIFSSKNKFFNEFRNFQFLNLRIKNSNMKFLFCGNFLLIYKYITFTGTCISVEYAANVTFIGVPGTSLQCTDSCNISKAIHSISLPLPCLSSSKRKIKMKKAKERIREKGKKK